MASLTTTLLLLVLLLNVVQVNVINLNKYTVLALFSPPCMLPRRAILCSAASTFDF